jgi:hypothetical protein
VRTYQNGKKKISLNGSPRKTSGLPSAQLNHPSVNFLRQVTSHMTSITVLQYLQRGAVVSSQGVCPPAELKCEPKNPPCYPSPFLTGGKQ